MPYGQGAKGPISLSLKLSREEGSLSRISWDVTVEEGGNAEAQPAAKERKDGGYGEERRQALGGVSRRECV
jgi:hypothetical protein